jgi:hypothetical protein
MSEFTVAESLERFREGLKKAASLSIEMGKAQDKVEWFLVAQQLHKVLEISMGFINGKALTKSELDIALERTKDLM